MSNTLKMAALGLALGVVASGPALAQEPYKIGISAGLTGYAATVDRAWRDGVELAVAAVNAKGGVAGRKLEVIVEDNRSEPQEAVTVYRKMLTSDKVNIFISGCVSAGNFAAAGLVVRAQVPMVLCSILPQQPDQVKWAYTTLPPAGFEVTKRLEYLKEKTDVKKIGVLHDPTPYANLQKAAAEKSAADYGIEVVGVEQYKQDDADLSVQIAKMKAAGAKAILKIGLGGTTLTAAKNIKQLGGDLLMLTSLEDIAVFKPVAEVLGDKFLFVASPSQVYEGLPAGPLKSEIGKFLEPWKAKFQDRDPNWASRGWDGVMLTVAAIEKAKSIEGPAVRDALETLSGFQGTTGVYDMSATVHQGLTKNPFFIATISDGKVKVVQ
ncbi:ABC transporter substrate-binding protein [Alsobacter metallidurans]|uniref:ABC transporter substrate-binding protein n=1 Tax=Alsobacter metallidurans TaxID=340221 RepID=A0A917IAK7_9HYPH|nr:ABC transporter substrate-binding protein [Alsobacter metallidurans]GGH27977.1 ABC transporter substrate-binding protein [Alsobacter metallidurans]